MGTPFINRHLGPNALDIEKMTSFLGLKGLDDLTAQAIPDSLKTPPHDYIGALSEEEALKRLSEISKGNQVRKSYIGLGYHPTIMPSVIQRNILENPGWYTAYTPYQAEISQGRMEALLNFQTLVTELTGLPIANASLLDESTAAAEAMILSYHFHPLEQNRRTFFVSDRCLPQTIDLLKTRAAPLGLKIEVGAVEPLELSKSYCGLLVQYPDVNGTVSSFKKLFAKAKELGVLAIVAADPMSLLLLESPGTMGADIAVGSMQRFGVPMGMGGPHAAYFATQDKYKRMVPGRFIGVSKDVHGNKALRLALQTREQHIRREKATSNICTSQVLLAVLASMYSVYHGPEGLKNIAMKIALNTRRLKNGLIKLGFNLDPKAVFDTLTFELKPGEFTRICDRANRVGINFRLVPSRSLVGISLNETTTEEDVLTILKVFSADDKLGFSWDSLETSIEDLPLRTDPILSQPVFNNYHTETKMLRYISALERKDLSLTTSMIPLGSCTMKLNSTTSMIPITQPEWCDLHPFAPKEQTQGYRILFGELEKWLCQLTAMAACSLQPNAGSQGELAGLLAIRRYHQSRGDTNRNLCLIPSSAHGTNPASAVLAGLEVVVIKCNERGAIDHDDLKSKIKEHGAQLAALMLTYPSTYGVFEDGMKEICQMIHGQGGLIYMDGANFNALIGFSSPGEWGVDVLHLNLHKTFSIPHGGGGPGVGPVCVGERLKPFLPSHWILDDTSSDHHAVSAAPWGSAGILPISWCYIAMMGSAGLRRATQVAILNANYIAKKLASYFPVLYKGQKGWVAHECIIDLSELKKKAGLLVDDVAKRLMDYGFHAPTMSWPVPGSLMIEPTESESLDELDRFCEAMISIAREIQAIEEGKADPKDNVLSNAPHTQGSLMADQWTHPYSRKQAAFPLPWVEDRKYWPTVGRVDNAFGDRQFVCTCG